MKDSFKYIPGLILSLFIASAAYFFGKLFPVIGGAVFGITFGMLLSFLYGRESLKSGINLSSKKLLQYSIVLIGFGMDLGIALEAGRQSLSIMLTTITAALLTAFIAGKAFGVDENSRILIGVGTSICGGSAIAAVSPIIDASDDQVARAISTVFLYNVIAVFLFPLLGRMMGLTDAGFGIWAGTAINDTSSVVAAGYSYSPQAGDYATLVKLARTLMILPVSLLVSLYSFKKTSKKGNFSFKRVFPWFIPAFLIAALVRTFGNVPESLLALLSQSGKFLIIVAMSAIGLKTNLRSLLKSNTKQIALGLLVWIVVAVLSLTMQRFLNLL